MLSMCIVLTSAYIVDVANHHSVSRKRVEGCEALISRLLQKVPTKKFRSGGPKAGTWPKSAPWRKGVRATDAGKAHVCSRSGPKVAASSERNSEEESDENERTKRGTLERGRSRAALPHSGR